MTNTSFPPLPLHEWKATKETLHRWVQIVGKIRMELMPPQNHWWHVPLYVTTHGLGTGPIPYNGKRLEITFDFHSHQLKVDLCDGQEKRIELKDGLSVSRFYESLFNILEHLDISVSIQAKPYDLGDDRPFADDNDHNSYDKKYVERFWHILLKVDALFRKFNQSYCGKVCPVQLYWHSFDLAVTRFSGAKGPPMPDGNTVNRKAYSHEVISFGFWAGDDNITEPAFYSYTYPAPDNLMEYPLKPSAAYWSNQSGSPMALLMYEEVCTSDEADNMILSFLDSAYQAGIKAANWDTEALHLEM